MSSDSHPQRARLVAGIQRGFMYDNGTPTPLVSVSRGTSSFHAIHCGTNQAPRSINDGRRKQLFGKFPMNSNFRSDLCFVEQSAQVISYHTRRMSIRLCSDKIAGRLTVCESRDLQHALKSLLWTAHDFRVCERKRQEDSLARSARQTALFKVFDAAEESEDLADRSVLTDLLNELVEENSCWDSQTAAVPRSKSTPRTGSRLLSLLRRQYQKGTEPTLFAASCPSDAALKIQLPGVSGTLPRAISDDIASACPIDTFETLRAYIVALHLWQ